MICNHEPDGWLSPRDRAARPSRAGRASGRRRRGFTLLEVLVALTILAVTLIALYQAFSSSLVIHTSTRGLWKAMLYVNNELLRWERMNNPPLHVNQGVFEEGHPMFGYRWHREVSSVSPMPGVTVRKVALRVYWNEGTREQTYGSEVFVIPR